MKRGLAGGLLFVLVALSAAHCAHPSGTPAAGAREVTANTTPPEGDGRLALRLIALNDFHGHLEPPPGGLEVAGQPVLSGGAGYLAAHVRALRRGAPHSLVVSAGDLIGASPLVSGLFHDEPTIEAMNLLGLDLNGVGNHELDEGLDELLRMKRGGCHPIDGCGGRPGFEGARFAFLAANVVDRRTRRTIFPPYEVRAFESIPVAFIGLTLEGTAEILPPVVPELEFYDEADTVNRLVEALRREGVRAIVLLLHEGGFPASSDPNACEGLSGPIVDIVARLDPEVDLVISGHTHQAYVCEREGLVLTSAGSYGRLLTRIDLELDRESKDVVRASAENQLVDHALEPDPAVLSLVEAYAARAAPLSSRVVTRLSTTLDRDRTPEGVSSLGRVIADAQLAATRSQGAEVAFMNSGGIRAAVAPPLEADGLGDVTYGMLFSAQPFGNVLVTMTLSGEEILEALEAQFDGDRPQFLDASSNLTYAWRPDAEEGPKVVPGSVRISGRPLYPGRSYRVTVNAFMATRGVFEKGRERSNGPVDLDALVAYLARESRFEAPSLNGVERLD